MNTAIADFIYELGKVINSIKGRLMYWCIYVKFDELIYRKLEHFISMNSFKSGCYNDLFLFFRWVANSLFHQVIFFISVAPLIISDNLQQPATWLFVMYSQVYFYVEAKHFDAKKQWSSFHRRYST